MAEVQYNSDPSTVITVHYKVSRRYCRHNTYTFHEHFHIMTTMEISRLKRLVTETHLVAHKTQESKIAVNIHIKHLRPQ